MKRVIVLALALAQFALGAVAQDQTEPPAAPPPPPCSWDEYRQFDFWIGEWEVRDGNGKLQGRNTIESILGGCALNESWEGATGSIGQSYNSYDRQTRQWHQTWIDNGGLLLKLDGGLEGNAMVLRGAGKARGGAGIEHEITWTPLDDGRVKQHWRTSRDGGKSWNDAFIGFYARTDPVE